MCSSLYVYITLATHVHMYKYKNVSDVSLIVHSDDTTLYIFCIFKYKNIYIQLYI